MRESEAVAPEEPLEGHNGYGHHAHEDEREGRLAAAETAVEEADAGNHEENEGGADHDPGHVAGLRRPSVSEAPGRKGESGQNGHTS